MIEQPSCSRNLVVCKNCSKPKNHCKRIFSRHLQLKAEYFSLSLCFEDCFKPHYDLEKQTFLKILMFFPVGGKKINFICNETVFMREFKMSYLLWYLVWFCLGVDEDNNQTKFYQI